MIKTAFDALIVANGENQDLPWSDFHYHHFVCTDGAALSLKPPLPKIDFIVGDLDSIYEHSAFKHSDSIQKYFSQSTIIQIDEQHTTDLEKAFLFAQQKQWYRILCLGAFGKAADHSLYNLHLLSHFSSSLQIFAVNYFDGLQQWIFVLPKKLTISAPTGSLLTLCTLTQATVTSLGLRWELERFQMNGLAKPSMRNQTKAPAVTLSCQGQCLAFLTTKSVPHLII